MKPSLFCVHILTPPFRYPLRYDLLPQELFNLNAPQHRPHPTPPDPFPFSGPQPLRPTFKTFFWEHPLRCLISMSRDIGLYLICVTPCSPCTLNIIFSYWKVVNLKAAEGHRLLLAFPGRILYLRNNQYVKYKLHAKQSFFH